MTCEDVAPKLGDFEVEPILMAIPNPPLGFRMGFLTVSLSSSSDEVCDEDDFTNGFEVGGLDVGGAVLGGGGLGKPRPNLGSGGTNLGGGGGLFNNGGGGLFARGCWSEEGSL